MRTLFFRTFAVSSAFPRPTLFQWLAVLLIGFPNIAFSLLYRFTLRRGTLRNLRALQESQPPVILFTWHWNGSYIFYLYRMFPELGPITFTGNNLTVSLISSLPMSFFGFKLFSFLLSKKVSGTEQIKEYLYTKKVILIFPDSSSPYLKIRPGLIRLAQETGAKLIPVATHADHRFILGRKMHHRYPYPGSKLHCTIGDPILLTGLEMRDIETCEKALNDLHAQFENW